MKALVVYDSVHGNTEKIAQAVGASIGGEVEVLHADAVHPAQLEGLDLLFAGSPTHGGWFTPAIKAFLERVPAAALQGIQAATFDTRMPIWFARIFGFAAGRIARGLKQKGATLLGSPEGFIVLGREGPLQDGELERAAAWAEEIAAGASLYDDGDRTQQRSIAA